MFDFFLDIKLIVKLCINGLIKISVFHPIHLTTKSFTLILQNISIALLFQILFSCYHNYVSLKTFQQRDPYIYIDLERQYYIWYPISLCHTIPTDTAGP